MSRIRAGLVTALLVGVAAAGGTAQGQYPERPVTIVVPFAPGGGTDILARQLAERLTVVLKQPFIVENKSGAGAAIGAAFVARATPDGYTLLMGTSAELTIGPNLRPVNYDPAKDFVPVALVGVSPNIILANPSFPPQSIRELVMYAKASPDKTNYGSGGVGTGPHMSGEMLNAMAGVRMTHIPYKGSGPAMADVISGQTQLMISTMAPALPMIKDKKVRPLAVTSAKRSAQLPDVPTVAEQDLPGYESVTWFAVMAPTGTPEPVLQRLRGAIAFLLKSPEVIQRMEGLGIEPATEQPSPSALQQRIKAESENWGKLIKENNIKAD